MQTFGEIYPLNPESIDRASDIIYNCLLANNLINPDNRPEPKKSILKSLLNLFKKPPTIEEMIHQAPQGKLVPLGCGSLGRAFAFKDKNNNTYVLKVFYCFNHKVMKEEIENDSHYTLMEPNRAAFIKKNVKKHELPEFYFADIKNDFMVTKFLDESFTSEKKINLKALGLVYSDKKHENIVNESIVDYGGFVSKSPLLGKNKTARWVYLTIAEKTKPDQWLNKWNELFNIANSNKVPNSKDILVGLYDFVRFLPENKHAELYDKFDNLKNFNDDFKNYLSSFFYNQNQTEKDEFINPSKNKSSYNVIDIDFEELT
ncbi:MAG: hypothetical protein AB7V50_11360 [Vampirovibrionia bacterium]